MTNDPKEQTIDWSKIFAQNDNGCVVLPKSEINDKRCPKISIGFSFTDVCGNNYSANTNVEIISDIESEINVIGYQFNAFLAQCGYARNNQFMLMKDLTEEEVELLTVYLDEIRNKRKVADKE